MLLFPSLFKGETMPRKAPSSVVEQRVTFGTFERALIEPILKQQRNEMYAKSALYGVLGLAGIATVGSMAYFGIKAYGLAAGVAEELDQTWEDVKEKVNDVWSGPETVETSAPVPMEDTIAQDSGQWSLILPNASHAAQPPSQPPKDLRNQAGRPCSKARSCHHAAPARHPDSPEFPAHPAPAPRSRDVRYRGHAG